MSQPDPPTAPSSIARTERVLPFPPAAVFGAFVDGARLARWWGPSGFRNTFHHFEFVPGGRWSFVMHSPDDVDYPNESVFEAIEPDARIVIRHVSPPRFTLTVALAPAGPDATRVTWEQAFESAALAERLRPIVGPANEQNLDRLTAVLAGDEST